MNLMTKAVLHHGEYVLDSQTGIGMFEITYLATHVPSGKKVVIKTLGNKLRQHSQFEQFKQQFQKLARQWRRCQHPHLVQVLNYFEEAGLPYLVTEFIQGQTLGQLIKTKTLPEAQAREWIHQVSKGVKMLHKAGLLHQDIKPENIKLRQDTDMVLCHSVTEFTRQVKQIPDNLPFEGYAAPEQYNFETSPTTATDIYALAATFYCLLIGHPPLPATVRAILPNASADEHRQLQNLEKGNCLSPEIKQAIIQGLELDPQNRPQTVDAWLGLFGNQKQKKVKEAIITSASRRQNRQSTEAENPNSLAENLVTTFKIPAKTTLAPAKQPQTHPNRKKSPLKALIITGAIAAAGGIGFGFALRLNSPSGAGSTIMHTEQSFPPTSNWPMSQPPAKVPL
jgi:eukaryotic-like serine/threonine-protein kinase